MAVGRTGGVSTLVGVAAELLRARNDCHNHLVLEERGGGLAEHGHGVGGGARKDVVSHAMTNGEAGGGGAGGTENGWAKMWARGKDGRLGDVVGADTESGDKLATSAL